VHEVNYLTKPIYEYHEFPEGLANLGHEVGVVHFPEVKDGSSHPEATPRVRPMAGRVLKDVEIQLFTPKILSGGLVGRLLFAATSYWQMKSILLQFQPDIIVCFSVPTNGWQALLAAKSIDIPFVFRALDVSHKLRQGPFSPLIKAAEKFLYRRSSYISANNPRMLAYCQDLVRKPAPGIVHLPPLDLESFAKGDSARGRKKWGIPKSARVILYLGTFFHFSGLECCLREFARAGGNDMLFLVGGGSRTTYLKRLAKSLGISNRVVFTGFLPFHELPDIVASADVAINPMVKSLVSDCALPHKVLQYMASGTPVVSTRLEGLLTTLSEDSGVVFQESPEQVIREASAIASNKYAQGQIARGQLRLVKRLFSGDPVKTFESFLWNLKQK